MKSTPAVVMFVLLTAFLGGCASQQPAAEKPLAGPSAAQLAAGDAIASARAALRAALARGLKLPGVEPSLTAADAAWKIADYARATKLANKARQRAESALNQYYLEQARDRLDQIKQHALDAAQRAELAAIEGLIVQREGRLAWQRAAALLAAVKRASIDYTVVRGDSLWGLAGKDEIYGNPWQWPLIYKANADKIKDADLLYPGQKLLIREGVSQADVDAAIHHAKTRGAWLVGAAEASDKAYLAK